MNYRLPILPITILAAFAYGDDILPPPQSVPLKAVTSSAPSRTATPAPPRSEGQINPQQLIAQAGQRLLALPGFEAKTRQRVALFDQRLIGSGTYRQMTNGPQMLLRWDLKLQVGQHVATWQQICNGDLFWLRQQTGGDVQVSRVNVRRLRRIASHAEMPPPPTLWMAVGGLPALLASLDGHFHFDSARPSTVGNLPVWIVSGEWKPRILATLLPDQRKAILAGRPVDLSKLPEHLPHGVTVVLGRDEIIPLFPYSVSYYRNLSAAADASGTGPAEHADDHRRRQPMVTWELFEVRIRRDMDPNLFEYEPGDQDVQERTDEYIDRLETASRGPRPNAR